MNSKRVIVIWISVAAIFFLTFLSVHNIKTRQEVHPVSENHESEFAAIAKENYSVVNGAASAIEYDKNYKNTDYAVYVYEADFDGDNEQEAFVVIGMAEEETEETVFGELFFIQDQNTVQRMKGEVFVQKDQTYVEKGTPVLFHFGYIDGITHKNKIYDMQAKEEEELCSSYMEKEIAGEEFVPWEDLLERIHRAEENGIKPDYQMRIYHNSIFRGVGFLGSTEHFSLYILGWGLLIKTSENNYIYGDIECLSNYCICPELKEIDIDGDGEMELAVITSGKYGTGYYEDDLYIADKDREQRWKIYHLLMSEYKPVLEEHFCAVNKDGIIRFSFDGKETGLPYEIPVEGMNYSYNYEIASQVFFFFVPDGRILLDAIPDRISEISHIGFGPEHGIQTEVRFQDGTWEFYDINYRDIGIDDIINVWLRGYGAHGNGVLYDTCFWEEIDPEKEESIDIKGKHISYVEISYPAEQVESGNVKAEVTIWLEGEAETIDYEICLVYGTKKDDREGWFIQNAAKGKDFMVK